MKSGRQKLAPGQQVLYTWQDPLGKRELTWSAGKEKNCTNDLVKVLLRLCYANCASCQRFTLQEWFNIRRYIIIHVHVRTFVIAAIEVACVYTRT